MKLSSSSKFFPAAAAAAAAIFAVAFSVGGVNAEGDKDCLSVVDLVCTAGSGFETLCGLLVDLELVDPLLSLVPVTVFAPTDGAFERASGIVETLTNGQVATVVLTHVFDGVLEEDDLVCGKEYDMASTLPTTHICEDHKIFQLGDANFDLGRRTWPEIVTTDIEVCEGIVHVVDNVIIPVLDDEPSKRPVQAPAKEPSPYKGPDECNDPYRKSFCHYYGRCIPNDHHCPDDESPVYSPVYAPYYSPVYHPAEEPTKNKCNGDTIGTSLNVIVLSLQHHP